MKQRTRIDLLRVIMEERETAVAWWEEKVKASMRVLAAAQEGHDAAYWRLVTARAELRELLAKKGGAL